MIVTTTNTIQGREIADSMGIVTGEAILGANILMVSASGTAVRLR